MKTPAKLFFSLLLASSGLVFGEPCTTNIYLADPCNTFNAYYRALWLQPTANNLDYAAEADLSSPNTPDWNIHEINPKYNFGYEVGLGMVIRERNTKLKASWEHFTSRDHSTKSVTAPNVVGPLFEIGSDATPYTKAQGRVNFDFDYACVDYGILVKFGSHLQSNFYAGISGARIKEELSTKFSNSTQTIHRTIKTPSRFLGMGPQFGVESDYSICGGLKVMGEASGALLVGAFSNHTSYKSYSPALGALGITPPNQQKSKVAHRTGVVPAFEGRLALGYSFTIKCLNCLDLDFEAGYKASLFVNAIQSTDISSEVLSSPVTADTVKVNARTFHRTLSNYALAGPYISLNAKF